MCPFSCGPAYLPAAILAGQSGGLPLVFGMTALSGAFESALAHVVGRLRVLFPLEVTGLVVSMVGIQLLAMGCPRFLGYAGQEPRISPRSLVVATVTLGVMLAPIIWSKGKWRLYPVLLGLLAGHISAFALGIFHASQFELQRLEPLIGLPNRPSRAFTFQLGLVLPFLIASLSSVLRFVGDLTLYQKINDSEWKRTDMRAVSGSATAGAIGTFFSGLLGGAGQSFPIRRPYRRRGFSGLFSLSLSLFLEPNEGFRSDESP